MVVMPWRDFVSLAVDSKMERRASPLVMVNYEKPGEDARHSESGPSPSR
jgi:hypothetical protein